MTSQDCKKVEQVRSWLLSSRLASFQQFWFECFSQILFSVILAACEGLVHWTQSIDYLVFHWVFLKVVNNVSVLIFFWNLQTVFLIKPLFSEGPSFFELSVCNKASLNFRLQDVTLPPSLTLSWPAKTAKKLNKSGVEFLVIVLPSSNSLIWMISFKFCLV